MPQLLLTTVDFNDVHLNLALEEVLLHAVSSGECPPLVRIWKNPESVIMGMSRSISTDLNLENIQKDSLSIGRRASGGGTVYHDPGTISFSFFFPWNLLGFNEDPRKVGAATIDPFLDIVIRALGMIGLSARKEGISDIFIGERKISGNAQKRIKGAILHHGTCLLDVDIEKMTRYLKVPPERKEIPHEQFVTSLKELGKGISREKLTDLLINSLEDSGYTVNRLELELKNPDLIVKARDLANKTYVQNEWIFRRP